MAKGFARTEIIGNLGRDPEMKYTSSGSSVVNFSVAVGRTWKTQDGTAQEDTQWYRCVAWDKLAEICNDYLAKGSRVFIAGRMASRKYTDQRDGIEREVWELIVSEMVLLDGKRASNEDEEYEEEVHPAREAQRPPQRQAPPVARQQATQTPPRQLAGQRNAPPSAPTRTRNQPQSVDDDDIPF